MKNRLFRKITISFAAFALFLSIPLYSWDAALAASLFHYKELEICEVKQYLQSRGVSVRL